jgi:hypothetical protein
MIPAVNPTALRVRVTLLRADADVQVHLPWFEHGGICIAK